MLQSPMKMKYIDQVRTTVTGRPFYVQKKHLQREMTWEKEGSRLNDTS